MTLTKLATSRGLILQGVRWQVGNWSSIYIWTQKWFPYANDYYIRQPRGPFSPTALFLDFITDSAWNIQKVVSSDEAKSIMTIPLSKMNSPPTRLYGIMKLKKIIRSNQAIIKLFLIVAQILSTFLLLYRYRTNVFGGMYGILKLYQNYIVLAKSVFKCSSHMWEYIQKKLPLFTYVPNIFFSAWNN